MKKIFGVIAVTFLLTGCTGYEQQEDKQQEESTYAYLTRKMTGGAASQWGMADSEEQVATATTTVAGQEYPTTIYFELNKELLSESALKILDSHAEYLTTNNQASIVIEGHADARGTQAYNLALSQRRARAIAAYLLSKGVTHAQMKEVSFGKEKLLSENHDFNRRAEILYKG